MSAGDDKDLKRAISAIGGNGETVKVSPPHPNSRLSEISLGNTDCNEVVDSDEVSSFQKRPV